MRWFSRCRYLGRPIGRGPARSRVTGPAAAWFRPLVAVAALVLVAAGCGPGAVTEHVANGRFTVTISAEALRHASRDGVNLRGVVTGALGRINALLPGPATAITIGYSRQHRIPQTGTSGFTNPQTGKVMILFGPTPQVSPKTVLTFWLPRALAHEVEHSVRILAGPGFGLTLAPQTITEGIATAFDQAAFPGRPDPWDAAITPAQECTLWKQAQPLLGQPGLYDQWMFGGQGIPHWTAFTIGYHIVQEFLRHHPHTGWSTLAAEYPTTITGGSHYQPCPT
jgi:Predicted Zn-dependent protease (DUF2268)